MTHSITTLLLIDGEFVPLSEVQQGAVDELYVEGAIDWKASDMPILSIDHWDLVDQLWSFIITGMERVAAGEPFSTSFPDQSLVMKFVPVSQSRISVSVDGNETALSRTEFFECLLKGSSEFFLAMKRLLPNQDSAWSRELAKIQRLRDLTQ